ncbi:MAG: hypothetical protein P4L84_12380 [Isosphaeraceae bacterium]|nr:hypothetical protein [Isosphaeraceae bacterium]
MVPTLLAAATLSDGGVPGYVVGWGTLSLINAGLAQSKNHSGLLWWFLSLLLGPIATFVIVVFLRKTPSLTDRM